MMTMEEQLQLGEDKNNINDILKKYSIEELINPKLNSYYKARLICHQ